MTNRHRSADSDPVELRAQAVVVTSGGIGHNFELMRQYWTTERLGPFPQHMIAGVPAHDGETGTVSERDVLVALAGLELAGMVSSGSSSAADHPTMAP